MKKVSVEKGIYIASERPARGGRIKVPSISKLFRINRIRALHESEVDVEIQSIQDSDKETNYRQPRKRQEEGQQNLCQDNGESEDLSSQSDQQQQQKTIKYSLRKVLKIQKSPYQGRYFCCRAKIFPRKKRLQCKQNTMDIFISQNNIQLYPCMKRLPAMEIEYLTKRFRDQIDNEIDYEKEYNLDYKSWRDTVEDIFQRGLFKCQFVKWWNNCPLIKIVEFVGYSGHLQPEIKSSLIDLELQFPSLKKPKLSNTRAPNHREIFSTCVFTVDPENSVDLDDALSLERKMSSYVLGVHIAGMTMYHRMVDWDDMITRTSTLYFPHRADHLLPDEVVSLATLDTKSQKYTLSVFIELDQNGQQKEGTQPRIQRTLLKSSCRLSYDTARAIIQDKITDASQIPPRNQLKRPEMEKQMFSSLKELNRLMQARYRKKVQDGYVVNSRIEMEFQLDKGDYPVGYKMVQKHCAHRMVQEAMVLANQVVAEYLIKQFPKSALQIHHPCPRTEDLKKFDICLQEMANSTMAFKEPLTVEEREEFRLENPRNFKRVCEIAKEKCKEGVMEFLQHRWIKCQEPAKYVVGDDPSYHHYALMLDHYTHFTSPMRRLCDNFIHKQAQAAIDGLTPKSVTQEELHNMNKIRKTMKRLKREMDQLFIKLFCKNEHTKVKTFGIVIQLNVSRAKLYIPMLGKVQQIRFKNYEDVEKVKFLNQKQQPKSRLEATQKLRYVQKGLKENNGEELNVKQQYVEKKKRRKKMNKDCVILDYEWDRRKRRFDRLVLQKYQKVQIELCTGGCKCQLLIDMRLSSEDSCHSYLLQTRIPNYQ